jgi:hypothetical protein
MAEAYLPLLKLILQQVANAYLDLWHMLSEECEYKITVDPTVIQVDNT